MGRDDQRLHHHDAGGWCRRRFWNCRVTGTVRCLDPHEAILVTRDLVEITHKSDGCGLNRVPKVTRDPNPRLAGTRVTNPKELRVVCGIDAGGNFLLVGGQRLRQRGKQLIVTQIIAI